MPSFAGTNPELLAATHAGCCAMALSFALGNTGHPPAGLNVTASVDLKKIGEGFAITSIALDAAARVAAIDPAKFQTIARARSGDALSRRRWLPRRSRCRRSCSESFGTSIV